MANVSVINGIATQGRYGNGRGQEYAEQFKLEYWRPELDLWYTYRQRDGNDVRDEDPIITYSVSFIGYSLMMAYCAKQFMFSINDDTV